MSIVEEFRNRIRIGEQWEEITWKVGPARVLLAYIEWLEQQLADTGTTHFDGCHYRGPKHYGCALRRIWRLEAQLNEAKNLYVDERTEGLFDREQQEEADDAELYFDRMMELTAQQINKAAQAAADAEG